jgi:hypothetical protein
MSPCRVAGSHAQCVVVQVYTPWENLRKGADMDVGQVGFKDQRQVRVVVCCAGCRRAAYVHATPRRAADVYR